eukprot:GILI01003242.1.p2 GENE.GILI01003242.1~~GILI01003242.1.p2  ORF type:complete len:224 (+),score=33.38 GILI01003242.1:78-749(+)
MSSRDRNTRVYVGRISSRTRASDLERAFDRYGRIRDITLKKDFAFIEFEDYRDADDAVHEMNNRTLDGARLIVEFSGQRRERRGPGREDVCFNCGLRGHWANECTQGDWRDRCYRCGQPGHEKRDCKASRSRSRGRDRDRRRSRSRSGSRDRRRDRSDSRDRRRDRSESRDRKRDRSRSAEKDRRPSEEQRREASKERDRAASSSPRKETGGEAAAESNGDAN